MVQGMQTSPRRVNQLEKVSTEFELWFKHGSDKTLVNTTIKEKYEAKNEEIYKVQFQIYSTLLFSVSSLDKTRCLFLFYRSATWLSLHSEADETVQ